jgi:hypothetical protein
VPSPERDRPRDGEPAPSGVSAAALRSLLGRAAEATASGCHGEARFGPIPVSVRATRQEYVGHVTSHAVERTSPATWPPVTVDLLDASDVARADLPVEIRSTGEHGPTWLLRGDDLVATWDATMLWVADAQRRQLVRWHATTDDLPIWEAIRPLRFALRWAATRSGGALLHTAAIGGDRGAVLLVGAAGAGKSTTAFACLGRGVHVLGDDYCLVEPTADGARVHATYLLGTLDDRSLALLPAMRDRVLREGLRGKSLIGLDPMPPGFAGAPVLAICQVIQAPGERTRLVPVSRAAALRALAPSTLFQIAGVHRETWEAMVAVVRSVPAFELRVGSLDDVAPVLAEITGAASP